MFAAIAGRYDLVNRVLSGGRDLSWRRVAVRMAGLRGGESVLDVCCGTGDFALLFAARKPASVTGLDFTPEMLRIAKDRAARAGAPIDWLAGDALRLPFADACFDVVSVGYGVRNIQDLDAGLRELARVLRPGGRVVILDCTPARGLIGKAANFYINRVIPWVGNRLSGSKDRAYSYLADSIKVFPDCTELQRRMEAAGFKEVRWRKLNMGTMAIHAGAH